MWLGASTAIGDAFEYQFIKDSASHHGVNTTIQWFRARPGPIIGASNPGYVVCTDTWFPYIAATIFQCNKRIKVLQMIKKPFNIESQALTALGRAHFSSQSDILMPMMLFGNWSASLRQPSNVPPLM
jgi:hypothetical protein